MLNLPKPIYALALATAVLMTGTPLAILIGGIVGVEFAPTPALATLPLAVLVLGVAAFALPASKILDAFGYQRLFLVGTILCLSANFLAIMALLFKSFYLWLAAMAFIGMASACAQQIRFSTRLFLTQEQHRIPVALSVFMLAGSLAAIVGPELIMINWFNALPSYSTGFIVVSALQIIALSAVFMLPKPAGLLFTPHASTSNNQFGVLAILASVTAYGIMSFVMTATPISMHEHHGHSLASTKSVIQWHILAMFLPSLFTGKLIQLIGTLKSIGLGIAFFLTVFIFTLTGLDVTHFAIGLILLGIGWNVLFTAGSTLAAQHADPAFKGKHDTWVFSVQAIASLSAGAVLYQLNWQAVQYVAIAGLMPLIIAVLLSTIKNQQTP